jgi:hypothetical protein
MRQSFFATGANFIVVFRFGPQLIDEEIDAVAIKDFFLVYASYTSTTRSWGMMFHF